MFRTMLFCPGNDGRKVARALSLGADAVILDLEDAVAVAEKVAARPAVAAALQQPRTCRGYVRVNNVQSPYCHDDVFAVVGPNLDGIVLPKVESPADLHIADWAITQAERAAGLQPGSIDLIPILETATGLSRAEALASATPRVRRLTFGAADFTLDTGMTWSKGGQELLWARTQVVIASRVANREAPIDTVYLDLRDQEGFEQDTRMGRNLGFQGRLVIHPGQLPVASAVYSPSEAEIAWSRRVVAAFRAAQAAGSASIQLDGQFVDYPIAHRAERILALAERLGLA